MMAKTTPARTMATNKQFERALAQAAKNETLLESRIETAQERMARSIRELEREVIKAASKAKAGEKSFGLARVARLQKELEKLFEETYGAAALAHTQGFRTVATAAQDYLKLVEDIPKTYTTVSNELLDALKAQALDTFNALAIQAQNRIGQALYNTALTGWSFDRLADEIAGALEGHKDVRGRPLADYARTYAQDSLMDTYATVHQQAAERAGLEHYLYYGTTVRDTRPFCRARVGKVFSAEEVKGWESLDWAGKRQGPILVVRGGWNCRHQLLPVDPSWEELQ